MRFRVLIQNLMFRDKIIDTEIHNKVDDAINDLNIKMAKNSIEFKDLDVGETLKYERHQGANIDGSYRYCINLMIKKHKSNGKELKG